MKLFKHLLVAPAVLGLIAPVTANATESDLEAISNLYQENIDLNVKSFKSNIDNKSLLLSGGEGLVESSADESSIDENSFSETTSASFGSTFYVGAVENSATGEATTFSYDF